MNHTKHEAFGTALWVIFLVYLLLYKPLPPERMIYLAIVSFIFCFIGSTLPDIDTTKSQAFRRMRFLIAISAFTVSFVMLSGKFGSTPAGVVYLITASVLLSIVTIILVQVLLPRHRGPIHSIATGAVYGVIVLVLSFILLSNISLAILVAFFAFLSFASH